MNGRDALKMLREWLKKEREECVGAYNRGLPDREYMQTVGKMKQIDATERKLAEVLKMRGDDEDDDT